jgi:uncharacterized membrane protein
MAFCAKCGGTLIESAGFCGACGAPAGAAAQDAGTGAQVIAMTSPAVNSGLASNLAGALAYVLGLITGIVFLVLEPYKHDRFVRFHAMQSILFCMAAIAFSVAWHILVSIMISISGWTAVVLVPIGLVISLGFFAFWLFLMFQAYTQREFRIPVIGAIAAKQVG